MQLTGNTIFITGGGSGIGRGLAEAFHTLGNQVIISGRRKERLQETLDANPGMGAIELDITDPGSIQAAAQTLISSYPDVNVLINNAGIMLLDHADKPVDDALALSTVTTNLLGPIRMTSALIEHLKARPDAVIVNVSSVLGFVPMAVTAVYSATKAALHSYTLSQRYLLRGSSVRVQEIAPPWVNTDLVIAFWKYRCACLKISAHWTASCVSYSPAACGAARWTPASILNRLLPRFS